MNNTDENIIRTVAAVIRNEQGEILLVRKQGSDTFIQPGGKFEPGETPRKALTREVMEELGVSIIEDAVAYIGEYEEQAVNESNTRVRAKLFNVKVQGEPTAQAEIAELKWVHPDQVDSVNIAPLSRRYVFGQDE
jgi:8-oxo-dGTP diphosphatase